MVVYTTNTRFFGLFGNGSMKKRLQVPVNEQVILPSEILLPDQHRSWKKLLFGSTILGLFILLLQVMIRLSQR